jgi:hypothetical protein
LLQGDLGSSRRAGRDNDGLGPRLSRSDNDAAAGLDDTAGGQVIMSDNVVDNVVMSGSSGDYAVTEACCSASERVSRRDSPNVVALEWFERVQ